MATKTSATTRNVRLAAQDLRRALELPENERAARIREATNWLLSANDEYAATSAKATERYFSAPVDSADSLAPIDALSSILDDARVGNTLIAAGHALDETHVGGGIEALDHAISGLQSDDFHSQATAALNFSGEPTHSADFAAAATTLRSRADECLKTFITEAHSAAAQVLKELLKHTDKVLEALGQLGGPFAKLPEIGKLIKKGIEKLQGAMDSLVKLLDSAGLQQVKEKLTTAIDKLNDGTLVDNLLDWALGGELVVAAVDKVSGASAVPVTALDRASDSLPALSEGFAAKMKWAKTLTGVVAGGAGLLLAVGAVAAGPLAVFCAGAYLLVLTAILLLGRDYAGEGHFFLHNTGLRATIESLGA